MIVAFLQNMWVRNPAKVQATLDRLPEMRERLLRYALFAGCLTGRRLKEALGEFLCNSIVWEECSPIIGGESNSSYPADEDHIRRVLKKHDPIAVVCLSRRNEEVVRRLAKGRITICGPHPAARHPTVIEELCEVRQQIEELLASTPPIDVTDVKRIQ